MDAVSFTVRNLEVPGPCGTSADDDGVVLQPKLFCVDVNANMRVRHKGLGSMLVVNDTG